MIYDEQNINILDEDRIQLYACTTWSHPIPALPHPNCCFLGSLGKKNDGILLYCFFSWAFPSRPRGLPNF